MLGQVQGERFVPTARTRALMPPAKDLPLSAKLDVDDPARILDLLAGRSLEAHTPAKGANRAEKDLAGMIGLYFQGLALGWLTKKGRRLLWSDR
ncbi:hypothetical protein [Humidesulfovibrio sp.]